MSADDEFKFLERMFRRLSEARMHRVRDEEKIRAAHGNSKKPMPLSAYETAELMVKYSIIDYLKLRREDET